MLANGIISLYSEGSNTPYTNSVEFLLGGISPTVFKDGTKQFIAGYAENIRIYSPKLLPDALEKFCEENISRYQAFHGEHGVDKLISEGTPLESFW
ncbi:MULTISPECIES: hypothetical protein [Pseudomonas]|uniref:hypothetical protein n=1 Tax=Pseudomonas TaxID=286 RepID=UPI00186914C6|nr:hypothetical protein [Pseudomonas lundensis]